MVEWDEQPKTDRTIWRWLSAAVVIIPVVGLLLTLV